MTTQGERLVSVEVEVRELKKDFDEHKLETKKQLIEVNDKLDKLLTLRDKGVGAFWLASTILGTGIVGGIITFVNWIVGK